MSVIHSGEECVKHFDISFNAGAIALRSERRALSGKNPGSNPLVTISKLWQFVSPHVPKAHSAV